MATDNTKAGYLVMCALTDFGCASKASIKAEVTKRGNNLFGNNFGEYCSKVLIDDSFMQGLKGKGLLSGAWASGFSMTEDGEEYKGEAWGLHIGPALRSKHIRQVEENQPVFA